MYIINFRTGFEVRIRVKISLMVLFKSPQSALQFFSHSHTCSYTGDMNMSGVPCSLGEVISHTDTHTLMSLGAILASVSHPRTLLHTDCRGQESADDYASS